jgi:hypothetical protein
MMNIDCRKDEYLMENVRPDHVRLVHAMLTTSNLESRDPTHVCRSCPASNCLISLCLGLVLRRMWNSQLA